MSRGRKKTVTDDMPVEVEEPEVVEPPVIEELEPVVEVNVPAVEKPVTSTIVDDKESMLKSVRLDLIEHSRRRPGSVSGMLPPVYSLTLPSGRVGFFTLPINIEEGAVEDGWKKCRAFMTAEEYVAFVVSVTGIPRPPFYSAFRVIALN